MLPLIPRLVPEEAVILIEGFVLVWVIVRPEFTFRFRLEPDITRSLQLMLGEVFAEQVTA
jgi:uncharacterized membrane protein